jgi:hypothetical protein
MSARNSFPVLAVKCLCGPVEDAFLYDPSIRPNMHIFVGSKAPWYTITDDLPQYREHAG